ncbi:MAG: hypothetical protein LC749_08595, partial [Actinobacteria bacterium]|nr:hypothetical protein [Actinomycetota bacterium]
ARTHTHRPTIPHPVLTREWTHADSLDSEHRAAGAAEHPDRFTLAEKSHLQKRTTHSPPGP